MRLYPPLRPSLATTQVAAPTPQFTASDEIPERTGEDDAYALYEVKLGGEPMTGPEQITRWQDELKAGRARAGALVGSNLAYLALTPADCAAARDALNRADELGSDQAAWQLAQLASNPSCGEADVAARERWLKKAVTLDYLVAAQRLIEMYSPTGSRTDPVQQYVYARVAGGYWEAVYGKQGNPDSRAGFDAADLQAMEKALSAADRKRAETEATRILTQMLKRHERFTPARPQEFSRGGQAAKASRGWGYAAYTLDYYHECAWNLVSNCRGAQRLAYVDLSNNDEDFMSCKARTDAQGFRHRQGRQSFARRARRSEGHAPPGAGRCLRAARQGRDDGRVHRRPATRGERRGGQVPRAPRRQHRRAAVLSALGQERGNRG